MDTPPPANKLRPVGFVAHATRGLLRDRGTRRKTIAGLVVLALLMVVLGATVLKGALDPMEHIGWFSIYWLVCGWLTITVMLMAVLDLLIVRSEARAERRRLRDESARRND